jgi:hypothetical protein
MAIPSFFKQTKPRGFKYVPRFYDPQKEEWEQKRMAQSAEHRAKGAERGEEIKERKTESGDIEGMSREKNPYRSKIMRGSMKNYFPRNRERVKKQSMIRFVVILIILAFVIYIYLHY